MKIFVGGTAQHRELIPAEVAITIHHVFTHTSGFSDGDDEEPTAQALEIKEPSIDFEAVLAEVRAHDAATRSRDFRARRAVRMARPSGAAHRSRPRC